MRAHEKASIVIRRTLVSAATAAVLAMGGIATQSTAALAATTLTVGNPQGDSFSFVPLAIGKELGIFSKHEIDLKVATFNGSAELEKALEKGTVEIALGSGTEFAFIPGGAPDTAVAALAVKPSFLVVTARPGGDVKAVGDLKGKSVGVAPNDPLPAWLVGQLSQDKGWGPDGIKALPLDKLISDGKINDQVPAAVADLPTALDLAAKGNGNTLVNFGDVVKAFPFYVAFARNDLISQHQDEVKDFLSAWFETVKWMKDNREEAIEKAAAVMKAPKDIVTKLYDTLMPAYSQTGKFDQDSLKVLAKALVTMKVLDREQDLGRYVNETLLVKGAGC